MVVAVEWYLIVPPRTDNAGYVRPEWAVTIVNMATLRVGNS